MRRLTAAGLCIALQVGALCAPLVHAHLDDHHADHHDVPVVHAHAGGHPQGPARDQPAIGPEDGSEQTTRLQVFVAVAPGVFAVPALPPARFTLRPALESAMRRLPELVRSHGPPPAHAVAPRAPPSLTV